MNVAKILIVTVLVLSGAALLLFSARSKKPGRTMLANTLSGIGTLALVNIASALTGTALAINVWTAATSLVLGIPGVIMMLLLKVILFV